jgi:hypothetical protein
MHFGNVFVLKMKLHVSATFVIIEGAQVANGLFLEHYTKTWTTLKNKMAAQFKSYTNKLKISNLETKAWL